MNPRKKLWLLAGLLVVLAGLIVWRTGQAHPDSAFERATWRRLTAQAFGLGRALARQAPAGTPVIFIHRETADASERQMNRAWTDGLRAALAGRETDLTPVMIPAGAAAALPDVLQARAVGGSYLREIPRLLSERPGCRAVVFSLAPSELPDYPAAVDGNILYVLALGESESWARLPAAGRAAAVAAERPPGQAQAYGKDDPPAKVFDAAFDLFLAPSA